MQKFFGSAFSARGRNEFVNCLVLAAASLIIALDYRTFVEWGGLYPGGATGLSILLQRIGQSVADAAGVNVRVPFSP